MKLHILFLAMIFFLSAVPVFSEEPGAGRFAEKIFSAASVTWKTSFINEMEGLLSGTLISAYSMKVTADILKNGEIPDDPAVAAAAVFRLLAATDNALRRGQSIAETKVIATRSWQSYVAQSRERAGNANHGQGNGNSNGNAFGRGNGLGSLASSLNGRRDDFVAPRDRGRVHVKLDDKIKEKKDK